MDKLFILEFAIRNLSLHRLRSLLTLTGVVIGISAIVFLASFAFGVERLVTQEVTNGNAFLLIDVGTGNSQVITLTDDTVSKIKNYDGVKDVYKLTTIGAKSVVAEKTMDVSFFGTEQHYLDKAGVKIAKGMGLTGTGDELLVNSAYAKFWEANNKGEILGQTVAFNIIIPQEMVTIGENKTLENQKFKITGLINDDSAPKVYTNLENLHAWELKNYSQFKVELSSQKNVQDVRKQIENLGLKTQYVGDTVTQISQVFGIFRAILIAFGLITLIVAILGMFNTLTISLLERIKEVALMKMLGMRKRDINNIFLSESLILGFIGGIMGLALGIAMSKLVNMILNYYAHRMGGESVSVFYAPWFFLVAMGLVSILVGFLTGLYPARRAVKVNALDVLRYE